MALAHIPVISALRRTLRSALASPARAAASPTTSVASSGPATLIAQTEKPACKPLSELLDAIDQRNSLPPHSRKRAPMLKAICSDRLEILRQGARK